MVSVQPELRFFMCRSQPVEYPMKDDDEVGYNNPPKTNQLKPKQAQSPNQHRLHKSAYLDLARLFDEPLRVRRGGKTISVQPHEAQLISLGKRALKGEARAIHEKLENRLLVRSIAALPQRIDDWRAASGRQIMRHGSDSKELV